MYKYRFIIVMIIEIRTEMITGNLSESFKRIEYFIDNEQEF